jgi:hypothetical protein
LALAPYESRVLVFSKERAPRASGSARSTALELSSAWKLTFPNGETRTIEKFEPWADQFYSGTATYENTLRVTDWALKSGRVFLSFGDGTPVDPSSERRAPNGMRAWLESPVREAAQVYINGSAAGAIWKPPYEIEVTKLAKAGDNAVRLVVANTALNLLAKRPLPDYKELIAKYGDRFQPQDMQSVKALPSGILGAVKLIVR